MRLEAVPKMVATTLVVLAIIASAAFVGLSIRWGEPPENRVENFVSLIQKGQDDVAYEFMSDRYQRTRSYVEFLRDIARLSEMRDAEFVSRTKTSRFSPTSEETMVCGYLRSPTPPDVFYGLRLVAKIRTTDDGNFIDALRVGSRQLDETHFALATDCPPSSR